MEKTALNHILLKTAFTCMACDGDIDASEIALIKSLANDHNLFGNIDITQTINQLLEEINANGSRFLVGYLNELSNSSLSDADQLEIIKIAIDTIKADSKIEYSEIKFFKVIRSKLKISNDVILEAMPDIEDFVEQDVISKRYLRKLQDDFLKNFTLPNFAPISK